MDRWILLSYVSVQPVWDSYRKTGILTMIQHNDPFSSFLTLELVGDCWNFGPFTAYSGEFQSNIWLGGIVHVRGRVSASIHARYGPTEAFSNQWRECTPPCSRPPAARSISASLEGTDLPSSGFETSSAETCSWVATCVSHIWTVVHWLGANQCPVNVIIPSKLSWPSWICFNVIYGRYQWENGSLKAAAPISVD